MNLENVTAELRPRTDWEAVEFGVRLIRRDAASIYRVWFTITLPMMILALLAIAYGPFPLLVSAIYWWLEPIADGPILRIISRRLFGESAAVRETLRSTLQLAVRNKIFLISPYRLHLARSIAMPITQLEGLRGERRRARAKALNSRILNHGIGVTAAYQHLVLALYLGAIVLVYLLVPSGYQDALGQEWLGLFWEDSSRLSTALSLVVFYAAQSALQPWFVGAGFGLYINCRTELEAWDIEVAFRRMVQRRTANAAAFALFLVFAVPMAALPNSVFAQNQSDSSVPQESSKPAEPLDGYWTEDEVLQALESVMADDALETYRDVEVWRKIDQEQDEPDGDTELPAWLGRALETAVAVVAVMLEFGLWLLVALILLLVFATRRHWMPYVGTGSGRQRQRTRVSVSVGEISADTLPANPAAEVSRLWASGRKRDAVSLLYRSSLYCAVVQHGVRLPPSATESQCVSAVTQRVDSEQSQYFVRVVSTWIQCAYGSREPEDATVQALCSEWSTHYGVVS